MDAQRFEDISMAISIGIFAIIGIIEFIGFLLTLMLHCLVIAGMCAIAVWAWYQDEYKSKGRKLNTLWQKKNTKH